MGTFGERMQREREMRGITLEEIAESTKIGTRSLRALEEEDFDKLPGGIFNKGFVRAYAKYLGIDEEQAVTDFMAAYGDFQVQLPAPPEAAPKPEPEHEAPRWNTIAMVAAVLLLAVCGAAWYYGDALKSVGSRLLQRSRSAPAQQARIAPPVTPSPAPSETATPPSAQIAPGAATPVSTPSPASAMTPAPQQTPAAAATVPGEFVLQFRAQKQSWVSITADDKLLMEGTLLGDKTVHARDKVVLKTGNAGGIEISFNGAVQPPLGDDGQVKTVVFTAAGMQR